MPLAKLERHLNKLPANITVKQMDSLESRLAALGSGLGRGHAQGPTARGGEDARRAAHRATEVTRRRRERSADLSSPLDARIVGIVYRLPRLAIRRRPG